MPKLPRSEPGHKARFDALFRSMAGEVSTKGSATIQGTFSTTHTALLYSDPVSNTTYDPYFAQWQRPPFMFDSTREAHERAWPAKKLDARWKKILHAQRKASDVNEPVNPRTSHV